MDNARLYYLDHLRAFAMLFGILVHSTTLQKFPPAIDFIPTLSDNFRMGTFFAVSGYFAALLLSKRPLDTFLTSRIMALAMPLSLGLIVLNPLNFVLIEHYWNGNKDLPWHLHLWFLISLLCYTLSAPILVRASPILPSLELPRAIEPLLVALCVVIAVLALRTVHSLFLEPFGAPWIVRATLSYWPYYILGVFLFARPALWNRLHVADPLLIFLVIGLHFFDGPTPFEIARREITVCASLFFLLWAFRKFASAENALSGAVSGSVYTVYLFHYIFIYVIGIVTVGMFPDGSAWFFALVATLTFASTFAMHQFLVRRYAILGLIMNGKRPSRWISN